ncbi:hypothetical protein FHR19_000963 [Sphingomonas yantingensis]|jgi:hypothetical protein|uniref:Uncharacterized protein n=2 Tax=Sphingomonas TaxID=13687 RepID=A0A7W9ANE1_9SPHN|nr:hypothetical protein [Sphingomonas yantingensis]HCB76126.1 hypothetical protein [Sphingomonas bacterium]
MSDHIFGMLDMAVVGVVVFGFGIWQLVSINREIRKDRSPERPGHSVGEHGLDDGRPKPPE